MLLGEGAEREWVPLNKREKLSFPHICTIASGNLVPGLLWNIVFTLLEPFVKKLSIKPLIKTLILFYGSFIGFVLGPLIGVLSDGLMFRYGRRRIFVIVGSIIVVISLLLMMYCVQIGEYFKPSNSRPYKRRLYICDALGAECWQALVGIGNVIYIAIPYAIVSIVIPTEDLGNNLGILNCFGVIGQQVSNLIIGMGMKSVTKNQAGKKIGFSGFFGIAAAIASLWIIEPHPIDNVNYRSIPDKSGDSLNILSSKGE